MSTAPRSTPLSRGEGTGETRTRGLHRPLPPPSGVHRPLPPSSEHVSWGPLSPEHTHAAPEPLPTVQSTAVEPAPAPSDDPTVDDAGSSAAEWRLLPDPPAPSARRPVWVDGMWVWPKSSRPDLRDPLIAIVLFLATAWFFFLAPFGGYPCEPEPDRTIAECKADNEEAWMQVWAIAAGALIATTEPFWVTRKIIRAGPPLEGPQRTFVQMLCAATLLLVVLGSLATLGASWSWASGSWNGYVDGSTWLAWVSLTSLYGAVAGAVLGAALLRHDMNVRRATRPPPPGGAGEHRGDVGGPTTETQTAARDRDTDRRGVAAAELPEPGRR